jgi:hypothetical protein
MSSFPGYPRLLKGFVDVLIDSLSCAVQHVIPLQIRGVGEAGNRSEALRLKGPLCKASSWKRT